MTKENALSLLGYSSRLYTWQVLRSELMNKQLAEIPVGRTDPATVIA
jgi:hypothetical protein